MTENVEAVREQILRKRFDTWRTLLRDLEKSAEPGHTVVRFPNSSAYIFSTGLDTFWLMDPAFSSAGEAPEETRKLAELIAGKVSFIVLTHLHADHCQPDLAALLDRPSLRWVVPENCAEKFLEISGIPAELLIRLPENGTADLAGIRITACRGYHSDPVRQSCVPSASYEVTLPDGVRLFFPADVRDYRLPLPDREPVDYTFGHVFLGREDAAGTEFSLPDDFCRFMTGKKCRTLILTHLWEIRRQPKDLWTFRHAEMIRERLRKTDPGLPVLVPRFGDAVHLTKDVNCFQDPFLNWSAEERKEFSDALGISLKRDHEAWMERAIAEKIPVLEWVSAHALKVPVPKRREQLERWRENGGRCLSIHFPNLPPEGDRADFDAAVRLALESRADRVTVHVPCISLKEMGACFDLTVDRMAELCRPLCEAGIAVGIENLHMKSRHVPDGSRPFGFIPPECICLTERLREKSGSCLWGIHLDIGHAYSNPPYHDVYDTAAWFRECGSLMNGMHIHQFERARTEKEPFLEGHGNIAGRNTGHPSLLPVFEAWRKKEVRVPMILEIMRGTEPDPFDSLARLTGGDF